MTKRMWVGNIYNENMLGDPSVLTPDFRQLVVMIAQRLAWFASVDDVLVLPGDLSAGMRRHISRLKGVDYGALTVVQPEWNGAEKGPLGSRELLDPQLLARLKEVVQTGSWQLKPYYCDRGIARLARALDLPIDGSAASSFLQEGGAEILNDKRAFRCLAASRGIPLAPGAVCTSCDELEAAATDLIKLTGAIIIKQDRNAGAGGNLVVGARVVASPGARGFLHAPDSASLGPAIREAWGMLAYHDRAALIVEAYYAEHTSLYAEFDIDALSRTARFTSWGEQRMDPTFNGFVIPPSVRAPTFLTGATELARLVGDLGFKGMMDVDGIITTEGEIIFNEVNCRFGASTHVHETAEFLLGRNYMNSASLCFRVAVKAPAIDEVLALLDKKKLCFCPEKRSGIVITAEDTTGLGIIEFMSIGHTREQAEKLELTFLQALAS